MSGPIAAMARCLRYHALFSVDAANTETPAPAYVIFEVDANISGRFGFPEAADRVRMSALLASSSVRWWKA